MTRHETEAAPMDAHKLCGVSCAGCGMVLSEPTVLAEEARPPCAGCGSRNRNYEVTITESIQVRDYFAVLQERAGDVIGFSETAPSDRAASATLAVSGHVELFVEGPSSQGEEDTGKVCEVLRQALNLGGATWGAVELDSEPADRVLIHERDRSIRLAVQVVRAITSQRFYHDLSQRRSVRQDLAPKEAAEELRVAIEHKANALRTGREALVLALDATRLPGLAFEVVVREFWRRHAAQAVAYGFSAIWLVGPQPRMVWRLDSMAYVSEDGDGLTG